MAAHTFKLTVTSMTSEKLSIEVPMTWSIAVADNPDSVAKFARRVPEGTRIAAWVEEIVLPTLRGESRAIAANMDANFLKVVASAIVDKYIGESARLIREMFGYARDHQPCIIFMDEVKWFLK